jgi:SAM-dependent methyltransferase
MHYDPIKRSLGKVFNQSPVTRKIFYFLLDLLLLRTWHIHRELRKWKSTVSSSPLILDAGSGFGQYSHFMSRLFPSSSILGVDVKEEQVADCNAFFTALGKRQVKFEIADLTTFRQPETYDLVLCVDVMEHIEEDVKVLTNYCQSLKKGGMLLISTPSDQGGSDVHEDGETSFIEEHVRDGYNVEDMRQKLVTAGFSRSEIRYSYGTPGKISWRLSMKYPMALLNTTQLFFVFLPLYYLITMPVCLALNWLDVRMNHATGTGLVVKAWK